MAKRMSRMVALAKRFNDCPVECLNDVQKRHYWGLEPWAVPICSIFKTREPIYF